MAEIQDVIEEFQWTFSIQDVVKFEETNITVYANTYKQAIKKIKNLKLPSIENYADAEESLKLTMVYEVNSAYDVEEDGEEEVEQP